MKTNLKKFTRILVYCVLVNLTVTSFAQQTSQDVAKQGTPVGTHITWGKVEGIAIEGMVQGPATESAPLQIACVFEYTEGDIFISPPALPAAANGMVHLDEALNGIITDVRRSGRFAGHALETLLIIPPKGSISATRLLLIGLGDRNKFTPDLMIDVAAVSMREAMRLGVSHYAFAADVKDAGINSPTALVAGNVVRGAIAAYRTQAYLKGKGMGGFKTISKITLLAGMNFFQDAGEGIKTAIADVQQ